MVYLFEGKGNTNYPNRQINKDLLNKQIKEEKTQQERDNGTGTIRDNLDFEIAKMRQEEY